MLLCLLFISALVCLALAHPFESDDEEVSKIVGGRNVTIYEFPWQVSLLNSSNNQHICGGVLISRHLVLTTVECVRHNQVGQVRVGSSNRGRGGYTRRIRRIVVHPNFNLTNFDNDIAVLRLRNRIYYSRRIQSVALPRFREDLANNATLAISGWGWTNENGTTPNVLHAADVQVIEQRRCAGVPGYIARLTDNMFCAGNFNAGGVGPCQGDQGGAAVDRSSGTGRNPVLHGLASWGVGCGRPRTPAVYTRVSRYVEWIRSIQNTLDYQKEEEGIF